jgi:hypothetical protein
MKTEIGYCPASCVLKYLKGNCTNVTALLSTLGLIVRLGMLFLDGVYVEHPAGAVRFCWMKAPASAELSALAQRIAQRVGRYLARQGLLQRDAQNSYLAGESPVGVKSRFVAFHRCASLILSAPIWMERAYRDVAAGMHSARAALVRRPSVAWSVRARRQTVCRNRCDG